MNNVVTPEFFEFLIDTHRKDGPWVGLSYSDNGKTNIIGMEADAARQVAELLVVNATHAERLYTERG